MRMTTIRWTVLVYMVLILTGCMTVDGPDGKYVLTDEGFKEIESQPVKPQNSDQPISPSETNTGNKSDSNWSKATGYCYRHGRKRDPVPWSSVVLTTNKDIDVVYPKIMREFKYNRKRLMRSNRNTTLPGCDVHLRFEEVPGSHYQMRSYIKHVYGNEESRNTIEVDLAKEGPNKVRIQVSYYSGHTIDQAGYEASLKQRILRALGQ
ncbi:MAG: hypothetical protein AB2805_18290 [Candidatus Thiodiazotropha sp.]